VENETSRNPDRRGACRVAYCTDSNRACDRANGGEAVVMDEQKREEIGDLLRRLVDTAVEMHGRAEAAEQAAATARADAMQEGKG
jgi:tRNA(Ile2) C34 agmatinyltransferase TiaS